MTAKIIPLRPRFRLANQGKHAYPAKVLQFRPRDAEARAYELYVKANAIDEDPARYDEAGAMYLHALHLDPGLALAHTNLGNIMFRKGDTEGALAHYHAALYTDCWQPEAMYNIGFVHLENRDPWTAVEWLTKATVADPKFADAHYNLGMAYGELAERTKMRAALKRYLELEPEGVWAQTARRAIAPSRGKKT